MKVKVVTKLGCDFCGKTQDDVERLIMGPKHVGICNECIALCQEILDGKAEPASPTEQGAPDA